MKLLLMDSCGSPSNFLIELVKIENEDDNQPAIDKFINFFPADYRSSNLVLEK
jgi:hypothetical protein